METLKFEDDSAVSATNNEGRGRSLTRFLCCPAYTWCQVIAVIQMVLGILSTVGCAMMMLYLHSLIRMHQHAREVKEAIQQHVLTSAVSEDLMKALDVATERKQESALMDQIGSLIFPPLLMCAYTFIFGLGLLLGNSKKKLSVFWMWIVFQVVFIVYSFFWIDTCNVAVTVAIVGIIIPFSVLFLCAVVVRVIEIRQEEQSRGITCLASFLSECKECK